ncbi:MAG: peroxidase-related enzyme [Gemmatimonadota bacterium]|nr:peroxidase-related enzyme [Gemmatimonadota bacterium]
MQHHGAALRVETGDEEWVRELAADWRTAGLSPRLRALLAYAEKLTLDPARMEEGDLAPMRQAGLDDEAVLHACEVVAYFNFVNRMADGLGVELEPGWPHPIFGRDREHGGDPDRS